MGTLGKQALRNLLAATVHSYTPMLLNDNSSEY